MTQARKIIQNPNLGVFVQEVAAAVKEGWELDEQNPACLYGFFYETHLLMDENLVPEVKPSRAEILGNARKAKAEKAQKAAEPADEPQEPAQEPVAA